MTVKPFQFPVFEPVPEPKTVCKNVTVSECYDEIYDASGRNLISRTLKVTEVKLWQSHMGIHSFPVAILTIVDLPKVLVQVLSSLLFIFYFICLIS